MKSKVLIIDKDPANRILLRQILSAEGYWVEIAGQTLDKTAFSEGISPDLVVLDEKVSEFAEIGQKITRDGISLLLTCSRDKYNHPLYEYCMLKPFSLKELVARIRLLLQKPENPLPEAQFTTL